MNVWGAWNEPDNKSFTLADIVDPRQVTPPGALIAARYWVDAQAACGRKCNVVAGEFAGYSPAWVKAYEGFIIDNTHAAASKLVPRAPTVWTIHAYSALLPGTTRSNGIRDYISDLQSHDRTGHLGPFDIWVTETGALLNLPGPPSASDPGGSATDDPTVLNGDGRGQFKAGQELKKLEQINPRIKRVFYYGAWAPGAPGRFDDQLSDSTGAPRPVLCGIGAKLTCNGATSTK